MKSPRSADAAGRPSEAASRSGVPRAPTPFAVIPLVRDGRRGALRLASTAALGAVLAIGAIPDTRADDAAVEAWVNSAIDGQGVAMTSISTAAKMAAPRKKGRNPRFNTAIFDVGLVISGSFPRNG